ncbi:glycosyltransferase family 39 protein [Methanothermobacter sp.]|uniref:glycosyltransferase family 39 protein n=1 Tax=Methanothermobacter sp. TaxID=1884223 RepID=UPI00260F490D|nr:glycosyltransferase family 39 protein [Methanothermobacter sp.]MDI9615633.1 glycosyltransferase family 39 protein [Methanothermobacter sp.]
MNRRYLQVLYTLILVATVLWIGLQRIHLQLSIGPLWDTYTFLANALYFAGKGMGYMELERPPMLSVILSIIFRLGYVHESAIYYLDLILHITGVLGLFLLMRLRFNENESLAGAILYGISPIVLKWVSVGYTDIAAISFSIWAIYLTALASRKDPGYFYLSFPLTALAFLTRFNVAFVILPIAFMIIVHRTFLRNFREIILGITFAFLLISPFLVLYYFTHSDPFLPFTTTVGLTETLQSERVQYIPDPLYYVKNIPSYGVYLNEQGPATYILILPLIGLLIYLIETIKEGIKAERIRKKVRNAFGISNRGFKFQHILLIILTVGFVLTFGRFSYLISDAIIFAGIIIFYREFNDGESLDLDLMVFLWLMVFLNFHSTYTVKVDRYFITLMPALAYFLVLGIRSLLERFRYSYTQIVYPIIILLLVSSALNYMDHLDVDRDLMDSKNANRNVIKASDFFRENFEYQNSKLIADYWPAYSWYLKRDVNIMPTYNDSRYVVHELEKGGYDYYFSFRSINSSSYIPVFSDGSTVIYARNGTPPSKIRALYVGTGWHRYLEDVLDFKVNLKYELMGAGRINAGKSLYVDSYSIEELERYPYLFLFNFRWHDRNAAEDLLRHYVENGGTLVIDASGNMDGVLYNLDNTVFLNTTIQRSAAPSRFDIKYGNRTYKFSNFVSEDGGPWYGATYMAFNGKMDNIASSNGKTVIGIQKIGKGRIIWIGYNLIFHAFYYDRLDEKRLIVDVLGFR